MDNGEQHHRPRRFPRRGESARRRKQRLRRVASPAGCTTACYQTAGSGGGAIYNGQWIQLQMTVTSTATGYYNLVYDVNAAATAGDTFASKSASAAARTTFSRNHRAHSEF